METTLGICDRPSISSEEKELLERPLQDEEIHGIIKSCESDKASGPNGFSTGFFKKCWTIIKVDLFNALNHFYNSEYFDRSLNSFFITLIPKKIGAKELKRL